MSKSLGNGIEPVEIVNQYGADILRLWVASSDYHADIRISKDILKQLSEVYRKIRNTARFILGNLNGFNPDTDMVSESDYSAMDRWALMRLEELIAKVRAAYDRYEYHIIYHAIHNFCVVDMSNFYLDVIKDRLYVEKADSVSRRAAQTVIYKVLDALTLLVAPILAFTSEEIWKYMPHDSSRNPEMPLFNEMPSSSGKVDQAFMDKWERIHSIREDAKKALELARNAKVIGASLEAEIKLFADGELLEFLKGIEKDLPAILIVSKAVIASGEEGTFKGDVEGLSITVTHAAGEKCERCWVYSEDVGSDAAHPTLCNRCANIVE